MLLEDNLEKAHWKIVKWIFWYLRGPLILVQSLRDEKMLSLAMLIQIMLGTFTKEGLLPAMCLPLEEMLLVGR